MVNFKMDSQHLPLEAAIQEHIHCDACASMGLWFCCGACSWVYPSAVAPVCGSALLLWNLHVGLPFHCGACAWVCPCEAEGLTGFDVCSCSPHSEIQWDVSVSWEPGMTKHAGPSSTRGGFYVFCLLCDKC